MPKSLPFCVLLLLLLGSRSIAQKGIALKEVNIQSSRIRYFSSGIKTTSIDSSLLSVYNNRSMADLLAEQSPVFVKNYGPGGLSTTSFRGAGAGHTAVIWNGFNLQSPLHGQIDFSLIPVAAAEQVSVQYGGAGALWGSGAVGGAIHLSAVPVFGKGISYGLDYSIGSFGFERDQLRLGWSGKKYNVVLKGYRQVANNNFPYYNVLKEGSPLSYQNHGKLLHSGLILEQAYRASDKDQWSLRYWYQTTQREIPPTMVQLRSAALQEDGFHRLAADWKHSGTHSVWTNRAAFFSEILNYEDSLSAIHSKNRSNMLVAESELRYDLSAKQSICGGINLNASGAISDGFKAPVNQQRIALFAAYTLQLLKEKLKSTLSARQEWISQQQDAFTYAFGLDYALNSSISLKSNIAKLYRVPTFNDLYWSPGGNPNLLPEVGYSGDIGLYTHVSSGKYHHISFEPTLFNRMVNNWIIWLPASYYWSPENIQRVWSRGLETRSQWKYAKGNWKLNASLLTNYVVSTNEQLKTAGDGSLGKQLLYVPIYTAQATFSVTYRGYEIWYNHCYTGYRYTAADHSAYLSPYSLGNLRLSKAFGTKQKMNIFISAHNLYNTRYEVLASRPMPLRNYQFGINFHYN